MPDRPELPDQPEDTPGPSDQPETGARDPVVRFSDGTAGRWSEFELPENAEPVFDRPDATDADADATERIGQTKAEWLARHDELSDEPIDTASGVVEWKQPPSGDRHSESIEYSTPPVDAAQREWRTIAEETDEVHSYHSYTAAKRELGGQPGQEIHHIVEQSQARPERSGFGVERINSTDNMVRLPVETHRAISAHYSRKLPGESTTVRDMLDGAPWDFQYEYGCDAVQDAMEGRL